MSEKVNKGNIIEERTRNPKYNYEMCDVNLNSVHCGKDLGVPIASNLKLFNTAKTLRVKRLECWIFSHIFCFVLRIKIQFYLLFIRLVKSYLENAAKLWLPHLAKAIGKLETAQHKFAIMMLLCTINIFSRDMHD